MKDNVITILFFIIFGLILISLCIRLTRPKMELEYRDANHEIRNIQYQLMDKRFLYFIPYTKRIKI